MYSNVKSELGAQEEDDMSFERGWPKIAMKSQDIVTSLFLLIFWVFAKRECYVEVLLEDE